MNSCHYFFCFWIHVAQAIKIVVNILAYNRPDSLLATLDYLSRNKREGIELRFWLDGPKNRQDLESIRFVYMISKRYKWSETKSIHRSSKNIGIKGQWLRAWSLPLKGEYSLFLEDDVLLHQDSIKILYDLVNKTLGSEKSIFGITLQRPKWQLGKNEKGKWRRLDLIKDEGLVKFIGPATWGTLFFPEAWKRFLSMANEMSHENIDGLISWKDPNNQLISPLLMKFAILTNLYTIYILLGDNEKNQQQALSISSMPDGVNFNGSTNKYHKEVLAKAINVDHYNEKENIPCYNYCFDRIEPKNHDDNNKLYWIREKTREFIYERWNLRDYNFSIVSDSDQIVEMSKSYNIFSFKGDISSSNSSFITVKVLGNETIKLKCPFVSGLYPDI